MDHHACAECRELISAFVDGELASDDRARMMGHLANCVDCRETLEVYRLIGTRMRALPAAQPPDHLIDTIFAETIDAQPRRLFIVSSRLGYSLAAVAAVLLIFVVAVYLIIGGYQRGIRPEVASTEPGNGDTWPIQRPIEITFNKDMDHESVVAALAILPEEESERLSRTWDGNTLIIGLNQNLMPGTSYQILIGAAAVDTFGNRLESDFRLSFGTTSTVQAPETPTPRATADATEPATVTTAPAAGTPQPSATSEAPQVAEPTATQGAQPGTTPDTTGGIGTPGTPEATPPSSPTAALPTPTVEIDETVISEPTATPTEPVSPSPTASPTTSPTPSPTATASATPQLPTATATTPATATQPASTPTEVTIPVTGGFGDVYWSDATIRERLGLPLAPAASTGALQLGFQGGTMYYRGDTATIYVMSSNSFSWSSFLDTSTASPEPQAIPDSELWIPGGVLGYLWAAEPSVAEEMGYAIHQYPASFSAQVQQFEGGVMLSSPDTIWVIYNDLTFDWFGNSGG